MWLTSEGCAGVRSVPEMNAVASFRAAGIRSGGGEQPLGPGRAGGQRRRLLFDGGAQLLLQLDERRRRRVGSEPAGDLEDPPQLPVAPPLVQRESSALLGDAAKCLVKCRGQELSVAERVTDAVAGDGVTVIARVPDQG